MLVLERSRPQQCAVFQFTTSVSLATTLTVCVIKVPEHGTTLTEYSRGLSKSANWGICLVANILLSHPHAANLSLPSVRSLPNGGFAISSAFIVS